MTGTGRRKKQPARKETNYVADQKMFVGEPKTAG
jgi:hypothetical protein